MKVFAATAVGAALSLSAALGQLVPDSDAPIDITGNSLEIVDDVATWIGDVRAVQGEAILTADKLVAILDDEGGFSSIRAIGAVRYANGKEAITGETALYDAEARAITITDNVVVTQGRTVMRGGALVYWLDTGRIAFTAPDGKRIRGIFYTKSLDASL
ncbi:LptA/OstA family protein [Amphiplicatus metriothermophilus]|uniref:Lipopolysaccharide export system protein LptA n=1 Tax=Amphiplicatus metriothermophilus TaxID=1519374 RepID=A0A239PL79_9PROT|nr:LptA/OstA family protein [Amphiplicatus metriothermophilus]MBB5517297.1 lipopolysaccharide export system protein LptA [Amphiplicatus metriothermophilus]SNT68367.1 lipopolysaccharide export system protein LptA [Amphiplicatus metriothermophilus]